MVDREDINTENLDDWWLRRHSSTTASESLESRVGNYEKKLIIEALEHTSGNQTKAANLLGTTKRIIQYKVKKYGINFRKYDQKTLSRQ